MVAVLDDPAGTITSASDTSKSEGSKARRKRRKRVRVWDPDRMALHKHWLIICSCCFKRVFDADVVHRSLTVELFAGRAQLALPSACLSPRRKIFLSFPQSHGRPTPHVLDDQCCCLRLADWPPVRLPVCPPGRRRDSPQMDCIIVLLIGCHRKNVSDDLSVAMLWSVIFLDKFFCLLPYSLCPFSPLSPPSLDFTTS